MSNVNTTTVYLTSIQDPGDIVMYNHYWFSDVLSGTSIAYPNTADGNFFTYTSLPGVTADDGLFFPWGYAYQDTTSIQYIGKYKGKTTINFSGTGLDIRFFPILRINYDFGDGESYENNRAILIDYSKLRIDSYVNGLGFGDPKWVIVQHTYEPSDTTFSTTYTAHVRVLNGNLVTNNFYFLVDIVQDSIFDFDDFSLLDTKFVSISDKSAISIFEASNPEYILNNLVKFSGS